MHRICCTENTTQDNVVQKHIVPEMLYIRYFTEEGCTEIYITEKGCTGMLYKQDCTDKIVHKMLYR